ncbi:MAG TPA: hypothetical protein VG937_04875 [Polyangiaceae bacterium]|nr:hypothetical protein [Polyangiaceae bacterium]
MPHLTWLRVGPTSIALLASICLSACGDGKKQQDDPLANAAVVRCDMSDDQACIEYQRVQNGNVEAFVALDEARLLCAGGWNGDSTKPGTFGEGACPTDGALARCSLPRGYLQLNYYYEGFADTETLEDPLAPLTKACQTSMGTLEKPPF